MIVGRRRFLEVGAVSLGLLVASVVGPSSALAEAGGLKGLGRRYGIFYFFAQSCGACQTQSPIMAQLRDSGLPVVAVSEDGGPNEYFPDYRVDTGQRARMGVPGNDTPTIVLFDAQTHRSALIGSGIIPAAEIIRQVRYLVSRGF